MNHAQIAFVIESNRIEGIHRAPTPAELDAHERFWSLKEVGVQELENFVMDILDARYSISPLRDMPGLDVRVGTHIPPRGGVAIAHALCQLLADVETSFDPYDVHIRYETLHPFMDGNGRSGRALWAWHMLKLGRDPFSLGFLHRWYYESLNHSR